MVARAGSPSANPMAATPPNRFPDWNSASKSDTEAFGRFFRAMLDNGVYLPPSQFEAAFLSAAHTEEDIQRTIAAAKQAFALAHA